MVCWCHVWLSIGQSCSELSQLCVGAMYGYLWVRVARKHHSGVLVPCMVIYGSELLGNITVVCWCHVWLSMGQSCSETSQLCVGAMYGYLWVRVARKHHSGVLVPCMVIYGSELLENITVVCRCHVWLSMGQSCSEISQLCVGAMYGYLWVRVARKYHSCVSVPCMVIYGSELLGNRK